MELEYDVIGMYLQPSEYYYVTQEAHKRLWHHPDEPEEYFIIVGKIAVPLDALSDMMDWVSNAAEEDDE